MGSLYQNVKLVFCHAVALYDKLTDFLIKSAGQWSKTDILFKSYYFNDMMPYYHFGA